MSQILTVADPFERAGLAAQLLAYARARADEAQEVRDAAVREARKQNPRRSLRELAEKVGTTPERIKQIVYRRVDPPTRTE